MPVIDSNDFTMSELHYKEVWTCHLSIVFSLSFALAWFNSMWSKLEQSVDAFIKARKELEEILMRKTFSLVLNLYNRRNHLCLHHSVRLRDNGFYYVLHIHSWHVFSFQTSVFFFFLLCSSISNAVSDLCHFMSLVLYFN